LHFSLAILIALIFSTLSPDLKNAGACEGLSPASSTPTYNLGLKYFRAERYAKAAKFLERSLNQDSTPSAARYYLAQTYNYLDSPNAALRVYADFIVTSPEDSLVDAALFEMGKIYKRLGYPDYALQVWQNLISYHPGSEYLTETLWNAANLYYKSGNYQAAYESFKQSQEGSDRRLYWAAKCADKLGLTEEALTGYDSVITRFDHSYYAYRSREALQALGYEYVSSPEVAATTEIAPESVSSNVSLAELKKHVEKGKFSKSINAAEKIIEKAKDDGLLAAVDSRLWKFSYPRGFWPYVEKYSKKYGLDPFLTYAVIREESRFRSQARSYANARGLMQIIPGTARAISHDLGLRYNRRKLYNPQVNIQMGAYFLSQLIKSFDGSLPLALAAYNGGPNRVARWLKKYGQNVDTDLFVEEIPFRETRNYVKKVMKSYHGYKRAYSDG